MDKTLTRSKADRIIAGVCGGIADYLGIDALFVRAVFLVLTLFKGIGALLYLVLWFTIPDKGQSSMLQQTVSRFENLNTNQVRPAVPRGSNKTAGIVLLVIGLLFLLHNVIPAFEFDVLWPLLLILVGILLLFPFGRSKQ